MTDKPVVRRVPCPACRQPSVFSPDNRYRPFCSARCAGVDLGAWANEDYRVAAPPPANDDDIAESDRH